MPHQHPWWKRIPSPLIGVVVGGTGGLMWGMAIVFSACIYPDPDIPCAAISFVIGGSAFASIGAFVIGMPILALYALIALVMAEPKKGR